MTGEGTKLLFFDVDGTLIPMGAYETPSPGVLAALAALRAAGHKLFLCTGRTWVDLHPALLRLGFHGVIAGAGCHIVAEGSCIYHECIPLPLLQKTARLFIAGRVTTLMECTDGFYYVGEGSRAYEWDFPRFRDPAQLTDALRTEKFTSRVSAPEEMSALLPQLREDYEIYPSADGRLYEGIVRGRDKADALRRVCRHYGLSPADTIAFGDGPNDRRILETAAVGVAMGNAPEAVRRRADLVTGTVAEDGVVTALRALALIP